MKIVSIAISRRKGTRKRTVEEAKLITGHGLESDAHAGDLVPAGELSGR